MYRYCNGLDEVRIMHMGRNGVVVEVCIMHMGSLFIL